jgi:SAM-dependent methyltransferase
VENIMRTAHGYDIHHLKRYSNLSQGVGDSLGHATDLGRTLQSFQDYLALGVNDLQSLEGRVVLDAGCGGGRFMAVACENGAADIVGLDLSLGGLLRAQALLKGIEGIHLIQGDITHPPFRAATFDIVYSIGVIHHLADPQEGFRALESLLSPGGRLWIWIYGLEGMSLAYRLSHLVWLRRLTRSWPLQAKFRLCRLLSLTFSCFYLFPLRFLRRLLPPALVRQLPFAEFIDISLEDTLYAFFDRLQPPYTHYLRKADLGAWLARLDRVSIECPSRRGWVVKGHQARG